MKQKQFTKKEVKSKIKKVLKVWEKQKLEGKKFSLRSVLGDYQNNSMNRFIKETLFYNEGDNGPLGATWHLKGYKKGPKKLAKRVMNAKNITSFEFIR